MIEIHINSLGKEQRMIEVRFFRSIQKFTNFIEDLNLRRRKRNFYFDAFSLFRHWRAVDRSAFAFIHDPRFGMKDS